METRERRLRIPAKNRLRIARAASERQIEAKNSFLIQGTLVAFGPLLQRRMNIGRDILESDCWHGRTVMDAKRMSIQRVVPGTSMRFLSRL